MRLVEVALAREETEISVRQIAIYLDISHTFVNRMNRGGGIRPELADRLAVQVGLHPSLIWGDAWWESAFQDELIDDLLAQKKVLSRRRRQKESRSNASNNRNVS